MNILKKIFGQVNKMDSDLYFKKNYNPIRHFDGWTSTRLKNLKGEIKTLSVFEYSVNKDLTKGSQIITSGNFTYVFNIDKKIKEEWGYRETKQIVSKSFIRDYKKDQKDSFLFFDEKAEIISGEWFEYNEEEILVCLKTKSNGEIIEQKYDIKEIDNAKILYNKWSIDKYINNQLVEVNQQNGYHITKYSYYPEGQLESIETLEDGNIITIEKFNNNGYLIEIHHYKYDKLKLVEKCITLNKYCEKNLKIEETTIEESTNQSIKYFKSYKYVENRLSEVLRNGIQIVKCNYNEFGDLIEQTFLGDKETYEYTEYDSNQNWIIRKMYLKDKLYKITEREIEYF